MPQHPLSHLSGPQLTATLASLACIPLGLGVTYAMFELPCYLPLCFEWNTLAGKRAGQVTIAVFYAWLLVVGAVLMLSNKSLRVYKFVRTPVYIGLSTILPLGEVLFYASFVAFMAFNLSYWYTVNFSVYWAKPKPWIRSWMVPAHLAVQTSGRLLDVALGLMFVTVTRHSFIQTVLRVPFQEVIKVHRHAGYLLILGTFAHGAAYFVEKLYTSPQNLAVHLFNLPMAGHADQWGWFSDMWMISYGLWATVILFVVGALATPYVRRRSFNLFYFSHFFIFISLFFMWLHAPSNFYYMLPGIGLYAIDLGMRLYSFKTKNEITRVVKEDNGYVTFTVQLDSNKKLPTLRGGQYFFLNVPQVSKNEWHPYSIGSDPTLSTQVSFTFNPTVAKSSTEWTPRVAALLATVSPENPLPISLEGPFGNPINLPKTDVLVILVGGTGLPPGIAVAFEALKHNKPVLLAWSTSSSRNLSTVSGLKTLKTMQGFELRIHRTGYTADSKFLVSDGGVSSKVATMETSPTSTMVAKEEQEEGGDEEGVLKGRMPFESYISHFTCRASSPSVSSGSSGSSREKKMRLSVFVCGPSGFVRDASRAAASVKREKKVEVEVYTDGYYF
ncbi:hypothetical protein HDV05_002935 [Chytridiales sp. JEL 0842]|nr:hypothetical protein HDV05_002935 [Chytridiales sp. JEL 0842]